MHQQHHSIRSAHFFFATEKDIENFVQHAALTPEGENLELLWDRAYREGYNYGRELARKNVEKKMEEKYQEGQKVGFDEGQKVGFDEGCQFLNGVDVQEIVKIGVERGREVGIAAERRDWQTKGHGEDCVPAPVRHFSTVATQATVPPSTAVSVSTQTATAATADQPLSPLPKLMTAVTTAASPAPDHLPALQKRRHSLPNHSREPRSSSQPPVTHPVSRRSTATSSVATPPKTSAPASTATIATQTTHSATPTPLHTTKNTQNCLQTPISDQNHPESPKSSYLNENTTDFYCNDIYGLPYNTATYADEEISRAESPCSPIHETARHIAATSPLTALTDYVSSTKYNTALENPTLTAVPELTTPAGTIDKLHITTVNSSTPGNAIGKAELHSKTLETPVLAHFNWSDESESLPVPPKIPPNHPRDLSGLRSSSTNPFSSLRRRHRQSRNPRRYTHFQPQHYRYHPSPTSYHHPPASYPSRHPSQPSFAASLDWDRDPRLINLSHALKALGWIRW
jgi:hypothetical protein